MDVVPVLVTLTQTFGSVGAIAVLLLFWKLGVFNNSNTGELSKKMDYLLENYNHRVTERDTKLIDGQERMQQTLEDLVKEQREENKAHSQILQEIKNMKEYGVKCREK